MQLVLMSKIYRGKWTLSWNGPARILNNCGLAGIDSFNMTRWGNGSDGFGGKETLGFLPEEAFSVLEENAAAILSYFNGAQYLLSDSVNVHTAKNFWRDSSATVYGFTSTFVAWLISRHHGIVHRGPLTTNHIHLQDNHQITTWIWIPNPRDYLGPGAEYVPPNAPKTDWPTKAALEYAEKEKALFEGTIKLPVPVPPAPEPVKKEEVKTKFVTQTTAVVPIAEKGVEIEDRSEELRLFERDDLGRFHSKKYIAKQEPFVWKQENRDAFKQSKW